MKIFGIAGWSGNGKTTLMTRVIRELRRRGLGVAALKHTHHDPLFGDDEIQSLEQAGAVQVMVASPLRWALVTSPAAQPTLAELLKHVQGHDLVLVEGFKHSPHPKLEVYDPAQGHGLLARDDDSVLAVACDVTLPGLDRPRMARDDVVAISAFIVNNAKDCADFIG